MKYQAHQIYHVFNQGNNRQPIFFEEENYLFFLRKVRHYLLPLSDILCYCLMPNHFHFLLVPNEAATLPSAAVKPRLKWTEDQLAGTLKVPANYNDQQEKLSQAIGTLLSSYTKAINKRHNRSGSLFRGRTKAKDGWIDGPVTLEGPNKHLFFRSDNDYARSCFQYIHNNPVKARLVSSSTEWHYSSAKDYAGLRNGTLCNQALATQLLNL
jgi:putative transposase